MPRTISVLLWYSSSLSIDIVVTEGKNRLPFFSDQRENSQFPDPVRFLLQNSDFLFSTLHRSIRFWYSNMCSLCPALYPFVNNGEEMIKSAVEREQA